MRQVGPVTITMATTTFPEHADARCLQSQHTRTVARACRFQHSGPSLMSVWRASHQLCFIHIQGGALHVSVTGHELWQSVTIWWPEMSLGLFLLTTSVYLLPFHHPCPCFSLIPSALSYSSSSLSVLLPSFSWQRLLLAAVTVIWGPTPPFPPHCLLIFMQLARQPTRAFLSLSVGKEVAWCQQLMYF